MTTVIEGKERGNTVNSQAIELLNDALRLEYAGIIHLTLLNGSVQEIYTKYAISALCTDSTNHAVKLAATIRELGGIPDWTLWDPPDNGTIIHMFEVQLAHERICLYLYDKTAQLLARNHLAEQCLNFAMDEDRHIEIMEHVLFILGKQEGLHQQVPHPVQEGAVFFNTGSSTL